jgi:type IV secretory pathway VirB2 component (pilin)
MQYVEMVSGAFVLLSGAYLLWYFYWRDVKETSDPLTDAVDRMQQRVQNWLNGNWQFAAIVLGGVIAVGIGYATIREHSRQPHPE